MGFLKRFFRNVLHEGMPTPQVSSFEHLSEEELEAHLGVQRYGSFLLTDAVRPSYDLQVIPQQGFRRDTYQDQDSRAQVPVLMASASKNVLFDLFMDLLDPLGSEVDVVLETSHDHSNGGHVDLYREHIDMPVLKSILWEYEEMLINDGCTGLAVLNPNVPQEVQFDEHKMLICYGDPLRDFESIFTTRGVPAIEDMKFITEAEHVHSSSERYSRLFEELKVDLGMDGSYA